MKNFQNKNNQLSLSQRITIEEMIAQRKRKHEIADALNKSPSNKESAWVIAHLIETTLTIISNLNAKVNN